MSAAACLSIACAENKITGNDSTRLDDAVELALLRVATDYDTSVATLLMGEMSDILNSFEKPLFTKECMEVVLGTLKGELVCMKMFRKWKL